MADVTLDSLPADIVFGVTDVVQQVMQNVKIIMTTRKGTQPLDRDFGISFDFVDSPIPTAMAMVEQEIFMAIKKYEPRAILKEITWSNDPAAGKVGPDVLIQVVER